jgi:ACS family allantoate permease-like MFS transporter
MAFKNLNSRCVGNLIGPQTFRENQAPQYTDGFAAMLVCYCLCVGLMGLYWLVALILNKRRHNHDLQAAALSSNTTNTVLDLDFLIDSFADLTDFQQRNFRYVT